MDRRDFLKSAGAGLALAAGGDLARAAESRPNVMLIIVDQMREPRWFPESARLPAYERLRGEGLSFSNHFTSAVPCSPSRASLFTGLHLPQHGVSMNMPTLHVGNQQSLDPRFTTLGHVFQRAGYRTPYFGKWHLSTEEDYRKDGLSRYGFEDWKGPDRDGFPVDGLRHDPGFTRHAVDWLTAHGREREPWLLTLSLINPHDVMYYRRDDVPSPAFIPNVCEQLPGNFHDPLTDKPGVQKQWSERIGRFLGTGPGEPDRVWRHYLDYYYYLHRQVDRQVSKALEALDRLGLAEDTLVIFTSDHGEMAGSHHLQNKGPFIYNENNQVPLVMRWPGRIRAGAETGALTQSVDLLPTLTELAAGRATPDHLPGSSIAPLLTDPTAAVNDHVLMSFGDWRALLKRIGAITHAHAAPCPTELRCIHDGRYKYARYFGGDLPEEYELYDLQEDPLEMTNLARDPGRAALIKELADRLQEALRDEMGPIGEEASWR